MTQDHLARYAFAQRFARDARVLDVGCGVGYGAAALADAGAELVIAVDRCHDALLYARQQYPRARVHYVNADALAFACARTFRLIVCFEVIEHTPHYVQLLANLHALLDQQGVFLLSSPNRRLTSPGVDATGRPRNRWHAQEFLPEELVMICRRQGLVTEKILGQRQQLDYGSDVLSRFHAALWSPHVAASPQVAHIRRGCSARYAVLLLRKTPAARCETRTW